MLTDVSGVIFKQFTERFQQKLKRRDAEPEGSAQPVKAVRVVGSALGQSIRRALGGSDEA